MGVSLMSDACRFFDSEEVNEAYQRTSRYSWVKGCSACVHAAHKIHISLVEDDAYVRVSVEDDGQGIPESERTRVLEPFVRLETSRSRPFGGVGLGLALVHRIVEAHGGSVAISEASLGGARVTLAWPRSSGPDLG